MHHGGRFDVVHQYLVALQIAGDIMEYFDGPGGVQGRWQGLAGGAGYHCHVVRECYECGP